MMKIAFVLLVLGLALAAASSFSEKEYQDAFTAWMLKYDRKYSAQEFQHRYNVFKGAMDYVNMWNADPEHDGTVLGLNKFADLTNAEYRKIYLGTPFDATDILAAAANDAAPVKDNYNATIDWTTKGVVTPIKDQGECGSCWSFSTTGSTEAAHAQKTGNLVSLSEQNLMDCSTKYGNNGCNGGLMTQAFQYIIANGGIDTEASYPYEGVDGTSCKYNAANSGATLSAYTNVTAGSETALATAALQQPVSVAIDAGTYSFQLYTSGVFYDMFCSSTKLDHGVLVVGFGVETGLSTKNYWIVKNSWGNGWGMNGYIYMSKDRNNNCGIASLPSYPTV